MKNEKYRVAVIVLSDKASCGKRVDESGKLIEKIMTDYNYEIVSYTLLPDEQKLIENEIIQIADNGKADIILTTGGTGFSARDVTPEATLAVAERAVPGIAEAIRFYCMGVTKRAMLSRAVSVIRKKTLIINLPGSPKAVRESLEFVVPELDHGLAVLCGNSDECGQTAGDN
jgi:molybdenum cofactor synthesis domain-containing protein